MSAERNLFLIGEINEKNASKLIKELYDIIDEDNAIVLANEKVVDECKVSIKPVSLTISSHGGNVFWGNAIINTLDCLLGQLNTHAVGICASMAVYIYLQGDVRTAGDLISFGLHGTSMKLSGYVEESKSNIDLSYKISEKLNEEIMSKTKITMDEIRRYQTCIRWMGYEEALEKKLITLDIYSDENEEEIKDRPVEENIQSQIDDLDKNEDIYIKQEKNDKDDKNPTKIVVNKVNITRI